MLFVTLAHAGATWAIFAGQFEAESIRSPTLGSRAHRDLVSHSAPVLPAKDAPPSSLSAMDLPTPRELELETLLRQRDAQVVELTVRTVSLR